MVMARRHGWELPLHTFQVVAITVFFLLSVAYYAFFAPFLGRDIYEYVAFGVYSVLDFSVFILYVQCTAIDPSDPGILIDADKTSRHRSQFNGELPGEVQKFSKHCRSCAKCVDGFDHPCRLIVEFGVGIAVLVRCFVDKRGTEYQIAEKLGVRFSQAPFATIVYVVAMRTLSEPGGEQQSVPTSPTSSAVTAISGRSSVGMSLQYKGAWCTPPRIFMDHQDEIIPHLEPDTIQPADKEKKLNQRPVRISAWKLAKLDSNEAAKAAAKARASSSVLRPISSRPYPHDADHSSGRSSPVKAGTSRSYPPSQASKEDSMSILSSPQHSNLATSPMMLQQQQSSNRDHFNPMYEQSPWSAKEREGVHVVMRNNSLAMVEGFWDQEAGRFVASSGQSSGELVYTGRSIFYGSPVVNEQPNVSRRDRGERLPVFVPGFSRQNKFPSR